MTQLEQKKDNPLKAYTVKEAAKILRISRATVYRMIESGEIQSCKIGRCRRFTLTQLESYLKALELEAAQ